MARAVQGRLNRPKLVESLCQTPADVEISSPSKLLNQSVEKHQVFSQVDEPGEDDLFVCMQIIKG